MCSRAVSGVSRAMREMDDRDSAKCQNWEKKDIDGIIEILSWIIKQNNA